MKSEKNGLCHMIIYHKSHSGPAMVSSYMQGIVERAVNCSKENKCNHWKHDVHSWQHTEANKDK